MERMKRIRQYYKVPAKRGIRVEAPKWFSGVITGTPHSGLYINVRTDEGKKVTVHPYELNYLDGDTWVIGKEQQKKHDDAWDRWNSKK